MISRGEQEKRQLMSRRMENMKVEAELSAQEQNFDDALAKHIQVLKHLISSRTSPEDLLNEFDKLLKILMQLPTKSSAAQKLDEILQNLSHTFPGTLHEEPFYAKGLLELGNFYFLSAQFKSALKCYDSLKSVYDQSMDTPFHSYGVLYANKGLCYMYAGRYSVAEENFKRALLCNEDVVGDKAHAQLKALVYQNLGCLYELVGNMDDSKEAYEKALKINVTLNNKDYEYQEWYYDIQYGLACVDLKQKHFTQSKERLRKTIAMLESLPENYMTKKLWTRLVLCHYTLGITCQQLRDLSSAKAEVVRAYELIKTKPTGELSEKLIQHIEKIVRVSKY